MARTQLTPAGVPGQRYGSFAGRGAPPGSSGPHTPGTITALGPSALPGRRYTFAPKGITIWPLAIGDNLGQLANLQRINRMTSAQRARRLASYQTARRR